VQQDIHAMAVTTDGTVFTDVYWDEAGEFQTNNGADTPEAQGWWVDGQGNVWLATETKGLRFFPMQGLDAHGNPQWDYKTMVTFPQQEPALSLETPRVLPRK
jgi:hypothetical protein